MQVIKTKDLFLAFVVVTVWGANFTVIKLGLAGIPPMLFASLRYVFAAFPAIFFVKRPAISWKYIIASGLTVGFGQFSCLFYAMHIGMPAGISSIVLQSQVFFTLLFGVFLLKESMHGRQLAGLLFAACGLLFIGAENFAGDTPSVPAAGLFLTVLAAAFWGISNIVARCASKKAASEGKSLDMLSLVVWASLIPPVPLLGMALLLDPPKALWQAVTHLNAVSVFSIFYLSFGATLLGYGLWSTLLGKYPAGKIAPLSLLVPVTGLLTARIVLGESLSTMQWIGGLIILLGLILANLQKSPKPLS